MNLQLTDSFTDQQRCRPWTPLFTQQMRLRHLRQITALNVLSEEPGYFYYTLHLTSMSAPFYTSEETDGSNPKWLELDITQIPSSAARSCVLRIWQTSLNEMDKIILTWGINFSGLVYLGNKLSDIEPLAFKEKSVILHLYGGLFTSIITLRNDVLNHMPFIDHLNIASTEQETRVYRNLAVKLSPSETKKSYCVEKLRKIQSLQIIIKNKSFDVELLKDKINRVSGLCVGDSAESPSSPSPSTSSNSGIRYASQLLTMNSLNKMLHERPTRVQRKEILQIKKEIELAKFRVKLLSQEKNRKQAHIRQLKERHTKFCDANEEFDSKLMEDYRNLSKETEKLRDFKKEQIQHREILLEHTTQLYHRRRQLMAQLLELYPIECTSDQKYKINAVHLPNSEWLNDSQYPANDLAVSLGFIAHILLMCSSFLQIPLRYPIIPMGSRSMIVDHIASIGDNKITYPLYIRGKDKLQFNYAVCLLNKNLAQLRWISGLHTQNLKATLPNLLTFLLPSRDYEREVPRTNIQNAKRDERDGGIENGYKNTKRMSEDNKKSCDSVYSSMNSIPMNMSCLGSTHNISDPILDTLKHECQIERSYSPIFRLTKKPSNKNVKYIGHESGLSQILAIPEAFLNQQISPNSFRSYMTVCNKSMSSDNEAGSSSKTDGINIYVNQAIQQSSSLLHCDIIEGRYSNSKTNIDTIEQGTDLTDPSVCLNLDLRESNPDNTPISNVEKLDNNSSSNHKRISRSVGSYDEDNLEHYNSTSLGSDPFLNSTGICDKLNQEQCSSTSRDEDDDIVVEKWLNTNVKEIQRIVDHDRLNTIEHHKEDTNSPLTRRTDALLNTTSFNLVKPKF